MEIQIKYVATRLVVRRIGKYLAFSARLPEEVIRSSATYDEANGQPELCTAGCPAHELVRNMQPAVPRRPYKIDREAALTECRNVENLAADFRNPLNGSFLEWCVFDLMTAGLSYDFITVAHVAQADTYSMDPSARDSAETSLWQTDGESETQPSTGASRITRADVRTLIVLQLLVTLYVASCSSALVTFSPFRSAPMQRQQSH